MIWPFKQIRRAHRRMKVVRLVRRLRRDLSTFNDVLKAADLPRHNRRAIKHVIIKDMEAARSILDRVEGK